MRKASTGERRSRSNPESGPSTLKTLDLTEGTGRLVFDTQATSSNLREVQIENAAPKPASRWLTRGNSGDSQPAYSPDGARVIFRSNRSGNWNLWEMATASGALRRITDDPGTDWDPGFTPDGKKILWTANRSGNFEIWIADTDGSNARQVTHDGSDAQSGTATPDGWVAYVSANPAKQGLWKVRVDGSQATRLVEGLIGPPEVSPDGKYAAYFTFDDGLKVVRMEDGAKVPFKFRSLSITQPRWMPGGRAIALLRWNEKTAANEVYVQDFDPGKDTSKTRRKLTRTFDDMNFTTFGISPDGSRIVVAHQLGGSNLMTAERVPGVLPPMRKKSAATSTSLSLRGSGDPEQPHAAGSV